MGTGIGDGSLACIDSQLIRNRCAIDAPVDSQIDPPIRLSIRRVVITTGTNGAHGISVGGTHR